MTRPVPEVAVLTDRGLFRRKKKLSNTFTMPVSPPGTNSTPRTYEKKVTHVVVFTDVGNALHDYTSLRTIFKALQPALLGEPPTQCGGASTDHTN